MGIVEDEMYRRRAYERRMLQAQPIFVPSRQRLPDFEAINAFVNPPWETMPIPIPNINYDEELLRTIFPSIFKNEPPILAKEELMAKKFADYTVEDLYRNSFSFLIKGIKEKELEETSLSEEAFIRAQKLALMNIFTCLNANEIDTNVQKIEPFLIGKRLETDINVISAKVEAIKALPTTVKPATDFVLNDNLATQFSKVNGLIKFGGVDRDALIANSRSNITSALNNITSRQNEIMNYSRHIVEYKRVEAEQIALKALDLLNPDTETNKLAQMIYELQKNGFIITKFEKTSDNLIITTFRTCHTKAQDADDNRIFHELPLLTVIQFRMKPNEILVNGNYEMLSYSLKMAQSYMHPHISTSNSFCLGNTQAILSRLTQQGIYKHIPDFVKIYADLLDGYNSGSPYEILQSVFMNNVSGLLEMAANSSSFRNMKVQQIGSIFRKFNSFLELRSIDENDDLAADVYTIRNIITDRARRIRSDFSSLNDQEALEESMFQHYRYLALTLTEEAIKFVENSGISGRVSFNDRTFPDASIQRYGNGEKLKRAFAILREFINKEELTNEEVIEESENDEINF